MIRRDNLYKKKLGNYGEEIASKYLEKLKYKIIIRNFNTYQGEIDIIAKDEEEYVFIEVKTRTSRKYGRPIDSINKQKISHIVKASKYFIYRNSLDSKKIRFDVIEVYVDKSKTNINHFKNILF